MKQQRNHPKEHRAWQSALLLCFITLTLRAQTTATPAPPPPKWDTTAAIGLTLTRGNSDTVLGSLSLDTKRKWEQSEALFGANGVYGEVNGTKNQEALTGFGQYNHLFSPRFYAGLRADGLYDAIAGVNYRFKINPLAGYYLLKEKRVSLAVEAGPSYVIEKLVNTPSDSYLAIRLGERFEFKLTESAKLWQTLEYLARADRWADKYLINAELGADAGLTQHISLRTVLQDIFDSQPSPGRKQNDVRLIAGVAYKF